MLRAAAHSVGTPIAPHPAQGRGVLSVAYLPQPQEECSQEETHYRRHVEVSELSPSPEGRKPALQPLGCAHHPLFRFHPCQGRYCFETWFM
jgi:hypothetical protein